MANVSIETAETLLSLLRAGSGMAASIGQISVREGAVLPEVEPSQIVSGNASVELAEKGHRLRYPALLVYCDKLTNSLKEKFRRFSGTARLNVEIRVSHGTLEGMERTLQLYVNAVTEVLYNSRGDWGRGISYGGGYQVEFGAAKAGGKNFLQTAKVVLDLDVSQS
ncbi:MAG: hypothetical protein GY953_18145 [bacterium]|nr:hypothetical protein [bacterium]